MTQWQSCPMPSALKGYRQISLLHIKSEADTSPRV